MALAWPAGVPSYQMKVWGPLGLLYDPATVVPFHAGAVVATNSIHMRVPFYGVLVDVSGVDVAEWRIYWLSGPYRPPTPDRITTVGWLRDRTFRAAPTDFLASLMVLTRLPEEGQFAWFPFQCVNPRNLSTYTRLAPPRTVGTDGLQAAFDALSLPQPFRLGVESEPFQPELGYVRYEALAQLAQKRAEADPALAEEPVVDSDSDAASELHELDIVGRMPPGHDEVDYTEEDLVFRDGGGRMALHDVTWSEASLRRFLCCLGAAFARYEFEMPELIEVMSLRGTDAVLCVFRESSRTTWASSAALRGVYRLLEMFKAAVTRRKKELDRSEARALQKQYSQALERAREYRRVVDDFTVGRDRAGSPLAWTAAEEEEHTGIPVNADEGESRKVAHLLDEARAILKERATEEVLGEQEKSDLLRMQDLNRVDLRIERRYEELLKTDADYLDLQRRRRSVQASLRRRAKHREQDEWAAGAS
jgi:hypothetical protein